MNAKLLVLLSFFLLGSFFASAQNKTISGKVSDGDDGSSLPGVTVLEKGTSNGTVTNMDGGFSLAVQENAVLVFSFIGYTPQEVPVAGKTNLNIVLATDVETLGEVVVVGYGQQERKDVTGSVTAISAESFNKGVIGSPQDLLVGKLAGVTINTNGGAPGSSSSIRIRGGASLNASNDPLIVIDGFPVDNSKISGLDNPLATINPNDIETFTVLKDASATAIYGARASNGVIIITTKKGKSGGIQLNYNTNLSLGTPIRYVDVLSGDEYRALAQDLRTREVSGINDQALQRLGTENTDWQKEIYQNAFSQDHNISVGGTAKDVPYRVSYGFTDQNGILKTTGMQRHTLSVNLNPYLFDDHLKINASLKTMLSETNFGNTGAVGAAVGFDPTQPVRNGNTRYGSYFTWVNLSETLPDGSMDPNGGANTFSINNPVALLNLTDNRSDVNRTIGNVQFDYRLHFLPDLRANLNLGIDRSNGEGINNSAPEAAWTYRDFKSGTGSLIDYSSTNTSKLLDFYLNYVKQAGKGKVDATAGYSWQHFERGGATFHRSGNGLEIKENSQFLNENFLVSFFGRLQYTFNDRYVLTGTLRQDGSSRFAKDNQWGLFPAVAAAWNISEENFLKNIKQVSNLKLRAGWGVTGQQDITDNQYPSLAIYRQSIGGASYQFGNQFIPTLRPDPYDVNIKWEETTTYNLGLDWGLAKDRFTGTIDVYQRETKDLINSIPIAAGSNFSNYLTTNVGNLENKGIELTLQAMLVDQADFSWNAGFNLTRNISKITKLTLTDDPNYPGVDVGAIGGGVGNRIQNHRVGYAPNSFYVFQQVYDADGRPIEGLYVDRLGEGGQITSNNLNKYHYNSPVADVLMGVNSSVGYKNFDFSFSGRFSIGNYVYNNLASGNTLGGIYGQSGYWSNVLASTGETQFINPQYWSDYYVENASFFKMDNISLGYNAPQLFTEKLKARLSFTVQNAFMVTKYTGLDPEVSTNESMGIDNNIYPRPRTFVFGLNLTY